MAQSEEARRRWNEWTPVQEPAVRLPDRAVPLTQEELERRIYAAGSKALNALRRRLNKGRIRPEQYEDPPAEEDDDLDEPVEGD